MKHDPLKLYAHDDQTERNGEQFHHSLSPYDESTNKRNKMLIKKIEDFEKFWKSIISWTRFYYNFGFILNLW